MKVTPLKLNEAVELLDIVRNTKHLHTLLKITKKLGNLPVLYRGFKNLDSNVTIITNDQTDYRGRNQPSQIVIDYLTNEFHTPTKQPIFTTFDKGNATEFGKPYYFIPTLPYIGLQNKEVDDLLVDVEYKGIQNIVPGYESKLSKNKSLEVLMFTKQYYLIDMLWFKQQTYNTSIKTYTNLNKSLHYLL